MERHSTEVYYCEQWFHAKSRPADPLTEDQARQRHRKGKLYTALLGDPTRPYCFLEFSDNRTVCVEFLDYELRSVLQHSFQEMRPNELFLSEVIVRHYAADWLTDNAGYPFAAQRYSFEVDGQVIVTDSIITPRATTPQSQEETTTDVTNNWEPFPEFGDYAGLAKRDRGIPILQDLGH